MHRPAEASHAGKRANGPWAGWHRINEAALRGETTTYDSEYRGKQLSMTIAPYRTEDGIVGAIGTAIDVTASRQLERRIVDAQRAERHSAPPTALAACSCATPTELRVDSGALSSRPALSIFTADIFLCLPEGRALRLPPVGHTVRRDAFGPIRAVASCKAPTAA